MVKHLLETIRNIRTFQHISQQNIADHLEITQSSYAKMERGQSRMSVEMLLKICEYLSINPSNLLAFAGNDASSRFAFYRVLAKSPIVGDGDPISEIRNLIQELKSKVDSPKSDAN